jgi:hypothetical protein
MHLIELLAEVKHRERETEIKQYVDGKKGLSFLKVLKAPMDLLSKIFHND